MISLVLLLSAILQSYSTVSKAQGDAEENLMVVGDTPLVKIGEYTEIKLYFEDYAGINYTWAVDTFGFLIVNVEWPILFGYIYGGGNRSAYQELKDYLCYHTVEFSAYIEGNKSGWYAVVEPSYISGTTMGHKYNLTLKVRVDGVSYSPEATVVIKVVRKGAGGKVLGTSYHRIPLKAEHIYLLEIKPLKSNVIVAPGADVCIPIEITNRGNYIEAYIIKTKGKGDITAGLVGSQEITLLPGETTKINVYVTSPFTLFGLGTPGTLTIEAYPKNNPDIKFFGYTSIVNSGISLLGVPIIIMILITILLLLYILISIPKLSRERPRKEKTIKREEPGREIPTKEKEREVKPKEVPPTSKDLDRLMTKIKREQEKQRRKLQKL